MRSTSRKVCVRRSLWAQRVVVPMTFVGLVLFLSTAAVGQASTSLRGTVTDPSGGMIGGAKVVLANSESKTERTATTGDQGEYQFLFLPPGSYTLTVTATGFKRYEITAVQLLVNTPATINAQLKVGGASEVIDVTKLTAVGRVVFGSTLELEPQDGGTKVVYQLVGDDERGQRRRYSNRAQARPEGGDVEEEVADVAELPPARLAQERLGIGHPCRGVPQATCDRIAALLDRGVRDQARKH